MSPVRLPAAAVLFDIDDTLVDFHGAAMQALDDATAAVRDELELSPDAARRAWAAVNDTEYSRFLSGELGFDDMRHSRMNAVLSRLDPDRLTRWDLTAVEKARNDAIFGHYEVFADVPRMLSRLTSAGIAIGVISNSDGDYQRRKLATVGLHEFVETAVCSGDVGVSKPDPAIFTLGVQELGVHPAHAVYVGDRWFTDTVGALRAGLGAVWLNRAGIARPERPTSPEDGRMQGGDPTVGRVFAEVRSLDDLEFVPR